MTSVELARGSGDCDLDLETCLRSGLKLFSTGAISGFELSFRNSSFTIERPRGAEVNNEPSCVNALNALFSLFIRTALGFTVVTSSSDPRLASFFAGGGGSRGGGVGRRRLGGLLGVDVLAIAITPAIVVVPTVPVSLTSRLSFSFAANTVVVSGVPECPDATLQSSFASLLNLDDVYSACRI